MQNRKDEALILKQGKRAAFMTGGNSTCRYHVRAHWDVYKVKCSEANLRLHHHAIPCEVWAEITKQGEKTPDEKRGKGGQQTLDFPRGTGSKEFT